MSENNTITNGMPVSESFILAIIGVFSGFCGAFLSFLLKSRCSKIKMCCLECERNVIDAKDLEVANVKVKNTIS